MRVGALWTLVRRDLGRTRGSLATSGFGIAAGTAALVFFLALGLGVQQVVGEVFPIERVELEPPPAADPGLLGLLIGAGERPGITPEQVKVLAESDGAVAVYPKMAATFPMKARGGKQLFGKEVGTSELVGDGIEVALVQGDVEQGAFDDPLERSEKSCKTPEDCEEPQYCEKPSGVEEGKCSDPVPVLVSPYLVEIFDKSLAPAHGLPPIGKTLVNKATGISFDVWLGESLLGRAKQGEPRKVRAKLIGMSTRAIDLGVTFPMPVVQRWNEEYSGEAAVRYSSVIVQAESGHATAGIITTGATLDLVPHDTRARDVSLLVTAVMLLLSLVAIVILVVSAANIAYTFRVLVSERRGEIALYRAVGATASDIRRWLLGLALTVGLVGGLVGTGLARLMGLGVDYLAATELPEFPFKPDTLFAFPVWLWAAGVGFAALCTAAGAFGPARRAAKVDPTAALAGP